MDPYRLSPRATEDITLDYSRPDVSISTEGPTAVYANQISGIGEVQQPVTWSATTFYFKGSTVTPQDVDSEAVNVPQNWFLALNDGISGTPTPSWTPFAGSRVVDGAVLWLNLGIYPN